MGRFALKKFLRRASMSTTAAREGAVISKFITVDSAARITGRSRWLILTAAASSRIRVSSCIDGKLLVHLDDVRTLAEPSRRSAEKRRRTA